jgi:hypothetical protein
VNAVSAAAIRRGAIVAGALGVTIAAHLTSGADARVLPVAPALWLTLVALCALPGIARGGRDRFSAWGPARLAGALVAAQLVAHAVLSAAPWVLGLVEAHEHGPWLTPLAAGVHLAAALLLTVALTWGERWVLRALATVAGLLAPVRRAGARRRTEPVAADRRSPRSRVPAGPRSSRGPPVLPPRTV